MYKFKKRNVSVYTIIDRRRVKINGKYPVKVEIIYKRKQKYYPTGIDLSIQEWESMWVDRKFNNTCAEIEHTFNKVRTEVEKLIDMDEFSFFSLDERLGNSNDNLNSLFKQRMEALLKDNRINSYYRFRGTLRNIEKFAGENIMFCDLTPGWLKKCQAFMFDSGKNPTSVNIYMKTLRCIVNDAVEKGLIKAKANPFNMGQYELPRPKIRKMALDKKSIEAISRYGGDERLEMYRDLWMFSYLCNGINFMDMIFLRYGNIVDGEIRVVRSKTRNSRSGGREIRAILSPALQEIIHKWGNSDNGDPNTLIFPFAKGNESPSEAIRVVREVTYRTNRALEEVALALGIPPFTTYSARHSFATVLNKGGADIRFISECLGHTNIKMTETYLAGFNHDERTMFSRILTDF